MKIKCNMCTNEAEGKCVVKKTTIKVTKSRKCNDYEYDTNKEIIRLERRARVMDQQEAAVARNASVSHPTTGDLSRFSTTAGK